MLPWIWDPPFRYARFQTLKLKRLLTLHFSIRWRRFRSLACKREQQCIKTSKDARTKSRTKTFTRMDCPWSAQGAPMKRAPPHTPPNPYWEAGGEAPAPTPASGEVRGPTVGRARARARAKSKTHLPETWSTLQKLVTWKISARSEVILHFYDDNIDYVKIKQINASFRKYQFYTLKRWVSNSKLHFRWWLLRSFNEK